MRGVISVMSNCMSLSILWVDFHRERQIGIIFTQFTLMLGPPNCIWSILFFLRVGTGVMACSATMGDSRWQSICRGRISGGSWAWKRFCAVLLRVRYFGFITDNSVKISQFSQRSKERTQSKGAFYFRWCLRIFAFTKIQKTEVKIYLPMLSIRLIHLNASREKLNLVSNRNLEHRKWIL